MRAANGIDPPELRGNEVHLWWGRVEPGAGPETASGSPLTEGEEERAARFHDPRHGRLFRARRTFLRHVLGAYLGVAPDALAFEEGDHGKPDLVPEVELAFNLSRTEDLVLVGVTRGRQLGVDVETHRIKTELGRLARQVFTAREVESLESIDEPLRLAAFFRGWTRKEAALKATGEGFGRDPRTLEVGIGARPLGELWRPEGEPLLTRHSLSDLAAPAEDTTACVCATGDDWTPVVVSRDPAPL